LNPPATLEQQRQHILAGHVYNDLTEELIAARERAVHLTEEYNQSFGGPPARRQAILSRLLEHVGEGAHFEPTFRCEFGYNVRLGTGFYANFDCVMLDGGGITIGDHVLLGPRVSIFTTNHALDPAERRAGLCHARPVSIGNDVWIGGDVTINPGVTIGDGAVIGSGSVVTSDIPPRVVAVGVPATILKTISDEGSPDTR
jgi:maltose O-acetyltransferase